LSPLLLGTQPVTYFIRSTDWKSVPRMV